MLVRLPGVLLDIKPMNLKRSVLTVQLKCFTTSPGTTMNCQASSSFEAQFPEILQHGQEQP
ncbi:hypothetical protein T10_13335 [Trichinella papuae]|uniref:Uncharacterized protein n=1 Tax=Trichinella papuae TaxID=268474 RepID=A0A0V1MWQ7_9BILA|nr:hypothetical protein T10_13335 [Trichinella papuae]